MTAAWVEVGEFGIDGGVGGDYQVSDSWSRRWRRPIDGDEWEVLTVYTYVVLLKPDEEPDVYDVEVMGERIICTDPDDHGSTEITADYEREYVNELSLTEEQALALAQNHLKNMETPS